MKILQVADTFLPIRGGGEMHVYYLTKSLLAAGHSVELFCGTKTSSDTADGLDCDVHRANIGTSRRNLPKLLLQIPRLLKLISGCDIVHTHYTYQFSALTILLCKLVRRPSVVTLHGLGTLDSSVQSSMMKKMFRSFSLKYADMVIATSAEMRDVALRFTCEDRIQTITNGVDLDFFTFKSRQTCDSEVSILRFGTLRRMVPKNGVQFATQALLKLARDVEFHATLIGDGPLRLGLEENVSKAGMVENFDFVGAIDHSQLKRQMEELDVLLFLSTAESFSLAALEAMASGAVVVASNVGAYPDLIEDGANGFMVELFPAGLSNYDAPKSLSDSQLKAVTAKLKYINDLPKSELDKVRRAARHTVEQRFGWSAIAGQIHSSVYQRLVKQK